MKFPLAALLATLATGSLAAAQAPLLLPVDADARAPQNTPFSLPSARVQSVYTLLGTGARVISSLGMRREGSLPNPGPIGGDRPGEPRSYQSLRILLGKGDVNVFGKDLNQNPIGQPTEMFRKPVSLPKATDWPTHPMPWSQSYQFPFSAPHIHTGTSDLLLDLSVDGGTIAGGPWTQYSAYIMDGWRAANQSVALTDFHAAPGCPVQLQLGGRVGATGQAEAYLGVNIAPDLPVITGFGVQGVRDPSLGVVIPGSCQPLMMQPLLTLTAATGPSGTFDIYLYQGPHLPGLVGVTIFAQGAYADPSTQGIQLTNLAEIMMPDLPDTLVRARTKLAIPASSNIAVPSIIADSTALILQLR